MRLIPLTSCSESTRSFRRYENRLSQGRAINVDRQDILGPNVHNRLLNHLQRGQVHHSIQPFGQVHLFQHRDRQYFNVVRFGAITVIVSDTSPKIVERDRHRQPQWSSAAKILSAARVSKIWKPSTIFIATCTACSDYEYCSAGTKPKVSDYNWLPSACFV